MYREGELIVYGRTGVCRITEIGQTGNSFHYVLTPLFQNCKITVPVDSGVYIRPVMSREEAERLVSEIPSIDEAPYYTRNLTQLKEHYREQLESHDCLDIARLTVSIYRKMEEAKKQKKKIGTVDERFMKEAETLLYGELSVALDLEREEVQSYIAKRAELLQSEENY